jgi:hypothetical protein
LAGATYGAEAERVDLDTEGGHVLLLELASQVALDEGGLDQTMLVWTDEIRAHSRPRSPRKKGHDVGRR